MALALAALAMSSATAGAAGSVRVVSVGGASEQTVDLAHLKPDVHDLAYTAVATPGGKAKTVIVRVGYSLPELFQSLQIAPSSFGSVEIAAPAGPPLVLSSTQATSLFAYHHGPPVVWEDGAGGHFLVPSTPSGSTNAGETFVGQGGTITIALHRSQPLYVGIAGLPLRAVVERTVAFSSRVYGTASAPYHYQWSLGDGTSSSRAAPTHAYTASGTYNVYLHVNGSQDSVGASLVLPIVVGNPPRRTATPGAGTGGTGNPTAGGGGTRGAGSGRRAGTGKTPSPRRHRAPKPPRPVGPLVSGIAISYVEPAAAGSPGGAGRAQASRGEQLTPGGAGLGEALSIALGAFALLLGGALLEWKGGLRARLATSGSR